MKSSPAVVPPFSPYQTTLKERLTVSGVGVHTGSTGTITLEPAEVDTGIRFYSDGVEFEALADHVVNTRRCTCIGAGEVRLITVEHLLSALWGMGVDNVRILMKGSEVPILDGSSLPWAEEIAGVGIQELDGLVKPAGLSTSVALRDGDSWMVARPADHFSLTCTIQFDHKMLGTQTESYDLTPQEYFSQIAPARTFGFAHEIEQLVASGLALGGSLDNALIVYDDHFSQPFRVANECLRHKALDVYGDLSLVGARLNAAITAIKPGHKINTAFAALLRRTLKEAA